MLYIIEFLLFLAYTILIFFIKDYWILGIVCAINIILMIVLKQNLKRAIIAILKLMPIIIFTTAINMMMTNVTFGLLIGVRLILVCNMTYIFSKKMTPQKLQYVIEVLLKPLKIIGVNSKEIRDNCVYRNSFYPNYSKGVTGD